MVQWYFIQLHVDDTVQRRRKLFRAGGAIMIIRTHLYGE